jgi:hypothetical protein
VDYPDVTLVLFFGHPDGPRHPVLLGLELEAKPDRVLRAAREAIIVAYEVDHLF